MDRKYIDLGYREFFRKLSFVYASALLFFVAGCVGPTNYFTELGEIGQSRSTEKHGEGKFYFHRSDYRFTDGSESSPKEKEDYLSIVETEIQKQKLCAGEFVIYAETLSYYAESGGTVGVLVKCKD